MCLDITLTDKKIKDYIDHVPAEGRKVYKVVAIEDGQYFPFCVNTHIPFVEGINKADTMASIRCEHTRTGDYFVSRYDSGYHFFASKEIAKKYLKKMKNRIEMRLEHAQKFGDNVGDVAVEKYRAELAIITCTIKREWITAVGMDGSYGYDKDGRGKAIVAKKAIFPKFEMDKNNED